MPESASDARPANCRERLREEGQPYPRSACSACAPVAGEFLRRGSQPCPYASGDVGGEGASSCHVAGETQCPKCGLGGARYATEAELDQIAEALGVRFQRVVIYGDSFDLLAGDYTALNMEPA